MRRRSGIGRSSRPSLLGSVARTAVVAGTATAVVGGVSNAQQNKADQQAMARAYQEDQQQRAIEDAVAAAMPATPPAAPAAASASDRIAQLERLAQLHQQGILTAEELASEKAKVLAS
jgi:hypothetical protein